LTGHGDPDTMAFMLHRASLTPGNKHAGKDAAPSGNAQTKLALLITLLFLGGCIEIRVPDPKVRYVAFGDSSTLGPSKRNYLDFLPSLLGEAPELFANEGRSGESSEDGLVRLKTMFADEIYPNAEVLLYWEGGNDISDFLKDHDPFLLTSPDDADYPLSEELASRLLQVQESIESAIAAARNNHLQVLVATYFFLREDFAKCDALPIPVILPSQARNANAYLTRLNERIRMAAANQNAVLVDVTTIDDELRRDQANYFDCNHLSEQGNAIVANLFFHTIIQPTN